jgi:hypothetical protein
MNIADACGSDGNEVEEDCMTFAAVTGTKCKIGWLLLFYLECEKE